MVGQCREIDEGRRGQGKVVPSSKVQVDSKSPRRNLADVLD